MLIYIASKSDVAGMACVSNEGSDAPELWQCRLSDAMRFGLMGDLGVCYSVNFGGYALVLYPNKQQQHQLFFYSIFSLACLLPFIRSR